MAAVLVGGLVPDVEQARPKRYDRGWRGTSGAGGQNLTNRHLPLFGLIVLVVMTVVACATDTATATASETAAATHAPIPAVGADAIADVDGTIDQNGVSRALRNRNMAFQSCHKTALKQNSKLSGKLVVEFTIGDGGKVIEALVVNDGLGSTQVSRCVLDTLKRVRFPPPDDGDVTITNTFVF